MTPMTPMPTEGRQLRRALLAAGALLVLHVALAHALDALGLVERLLAPSGPWALLMLPLTLVFFAVRLSILFLMPGLVAAALLFWALRGPRQRPTSRSNASSGS